MNDREGIDRLHELHRKKTMHRDRNSSMRASSSSCKAQGEIDDDQDALDRADETLEIWKGAQ